MNVLTSCHLAIYFMVTPSRLNRLAIIFLSAMLLIKMRSKKHEKTCSDERYLNLKIDTKILELIIRRWFKIIKNTVDKDCQDPRKAHTLHVSKRDYFKSRVVYRFSYHSCNVKYIGKTYRNSGVYLKKKIWVR